MYLNYYPHTRIHETREALEREYNRIQGTVRTMPITQLDDAHKRNIDRVLNSYAYQIGYDLRVITDASYNTNTGTMLSRMNHRTLYRTFRIPKRTGGFREICAPTERLKEAQRNILKLFQKRLKVLTHNAAHGCVKNRNCKTALEVHQKNNSKWFLKLDLHDAFGSVYKEYLRRALEENAITNYALFEYETYIGADGLTHLIDSILAFAYNDSVSRGLPQGSPLSPFMLNMYMQTFDEALTKFCKDRGLVYTRYVDDLLISGYEKFDKDEVMAFIVTALPPNMQLNAAKTRFGSSNWKNWNLGIMLNKDNNLTPGSYNKHKLKCAVHNYNSNEELQTRDNYYHLSGVIAYYKHIEPEYFTNNPHFVLTTPGGNVLPLIE